MATVREDVVSISFEVQDNPFDDLIKQTEELKKGLGDIGDPIKIPKPDMPKMPEMPDTKVPTPEVSKPDPNTFTGMIKQLKEATKMKVDGGFEKLKASADKVKTSLSAIKNIKLSDVAHGLDVGLGKAVQGAGKLLSSLKNVAKTSMNALVSGLGKVASLGAKAAVSVGKIAMKGLAVGGSAVAGLVGGAVKSFADYEQLIGGVETLFKDSAPLVQQYANDAYKTAGLSANQYMDTVTSFSASMLQSVGGDTTKAAELSNMAVSDMADNANKMGTDMDSIIQTYQSLSRGNYAMLDNLKLGYGGTKEELNRLINDASELDSAVAANDMSYANIAKAIHAVQENMGITGTTALEAEETISGSLSSMKSAWGNMLTALVTGGSSFDQSVKNLVNSVKTFAGNIMPVIQSALSGVTSLITELAPMIGSALPELVTTLVPQLLTAGMELIRALIQGIQSNIGNIVSAATQIITSLVAFLLQAVPQIILTGLQLLMGLAQGISQAIPTLLPMAVEAVGQFVLGLVQMLPQLISTGLQLIMNLAQGIVTALPQIISYGSMAIIQFVQGLTQSIPMIIQTGVQLIPTLLQGIISNLPALLLAGVQIILAIAEGILTAVPALLSAIPQILTSIKDTIVNTDWAAVGKEIVTKLGDALMSGLKGIGEKVKGFFGDIKGFFTGGEEAEAAAETVGKEMGDSVVKGIESSKPAVQNAALTTSTTAAQSFKLDTSMLNLEGLQAGTTLANGITAGSGTVAGAAMGLSTMTASSFTMPDLSSLGMDAAASMAGGIASNTGTAVGAAQNMSSQVQTAAATEVEVKIKAETSSLDTFKTAIQSFAETAASGIQAVPRAFTTVMQTISAVVQTHMNAASTALESGLTTMSGSSSSFVGNFTALFTVGFAATLAVVQAAMNSMVSAVSSACSQMISIASSCVSSIQSTFAGANLYGAGANMMAGLVSGMQSMAGTVMAVAGNIASQASAAINSALKIHSPSRVTMESGEYTAEGFALGMQNKKDRIVQEASTLALNSVINMEPRARYTPTASSISNVTNSSNTSTTTYAPQFVLNLNGASATDTNKRKIQRWVKESINEAFESMGRTNPKTAYV